MSLCCINLSLSCTKYYIRIYCIGLYGFVNQVQKLAADVLERIPEDIDYEGTEKILKDDPSPLNVVLLQEVGWQEVTSEGND